MPTKNPPKLKEKIKKLEKAPNAQKPPKEKATKKPKKEEKKEKKEKAEKKEKEENEKRQLNKTEQWLESNAKPKNYKFPREKPEPTRFQKPGPMTVKDWARFYSWLSKNIPKRPKRPRPSAVPKKKKRLTSNDRKLLASRMERLRKLATPKYQREKYEYPPEPKYPFIPTIDPKRPAEQEKCRPFEPIRLPYWWYHEELEAEFWRDMRFPISCAALKYKPSKNIKELSKPKTYPIKQHCFIPEVEEEEPPKRTKMTPKQWKEHLIRLEYLSDPMYRQNKGKRVLAGGEMKDQSKEGSIQEEKAKSECGSECESATGSASGSGFWSKMYKRKS